MTTLLPSRIPSGRWTHCTESSVTMTRAFIDAVAMVMKSVRVADSFYNLIEGSGPYTLWTPIAMDPQKKCPRDFAYQDVPFLWDMVTAPYNPDNLHVSPKTAEAFKKFIDPLRDDLIKAQSSVNPVHNLFAASACSGFVQFDPNPYTRFYAMESVMDRLDYSALQSLGPGDTVYLGRSPAHSSSQSLSLSFTVNFDDGSVVFDRPPEPIRGLNFNVVGPSVLLAARYLVRSGILEKVQSGEMSKNDAWWLSFYLFAFVFGYISASPQFDSVFTDDTRNPDLLKTSVMEGASTLKVSSGHSDESSEFDDLMRSMTAHAKRKAFEAFDESGLRDSARLFTEEANFCELDALNFTQLTSGFELEPDDTRFWNIFALSMAILSRLGTTHSKIINECAPALANLMCIERSHTGAVNLFDLTKAIQPFMVTRRENGFPQMLPFLTESGGVPEGLDSSSMISLLFVDPAHRNYVAKGFYGTVDVSHGSYHSLAFPRLTEYARYVAGTASVDRDSYSCALGPDTHPSRSLATQNVLCVVTQPD